jgi:hypothetical protein
MTNNSWSVGRPNDKSFTHNKVPGESNLSIIIEYLKTMSCFIVDLIVSIAYINLLVSPSFINLCLAITVAVVVFPFTKTQSGLINKSVWTISSLLLMYLCVYLCPWEQLGITSLSSNELALYILPYLTLFQISRMISSIRNQYSRGVIFLINVIKELRQVNFFEQNLLFNVFQAVNLSILLMAILTYSDKISKFLISKAVDFFTKL